jgi:malate/lactate dehydrogenase
VYLGTTGLAKRQPSDILGDKEKRDALINRIQFGGDEVVKAKGKLANLDDGD